MIRRRCAALLLAAIVAQGCSVRPEQTIIGDFFAASRLRDFTALSRFATVAFEPREQGTVSAFTIRSVSPEHAEGDMRVKDVVVEAPVRTPDGGTIEKVFVIRLQRRGSATTPSDALYAGWIVTGVTDAAASRVPPPS